MNEPVKYKRLIELASELNEKLDELNIGKLSREELESLTDHSRELYERLVVLRFKVYDNEVKDSQVQENTPEPIPFRIAGNKPEVANTKQVSLIDAIEEVKKSTEIPAVQVAAAQGNTFMAPSPKPAEKPQITESLHDRLSRDIGMKESLGDKLVAAPINDLKRAISLNQRFQFSRELFKGNNQEYEQAIDRLNTLSRDEAMKHLDSLRSKYTWDTDQAVTMDFMDLVSRRHQ